jgi:hypothetical protein
VTKRTFRKSSILLINRNPQRPMNRKLILAALTSPTLIGSLMAIATTLNSIPSQAAESPPLVNSCLIPLHGRQYGKLTCQKITPEAMAARNAWEAEQLKAAANPVKTPEVMPLKLEFTDEESDAAVVVFGCDCPSCLNMLRQMRGLPPVV